MVRINLDKTITVVSEIGDCTKWAFGALFRLCVKDGSKEHILENTLRDDWQKFRENSSLASGSVEA